MKPIFCSLILGTTFVTLAASPAALAQGVPLNRFDPAPTGDRMFGVPSPTVAGDAVLRASVLFDYAHNPLVFHEVAANDNVGALVEHQLHLHLNASLSLWNRVGINVVMPFALLQSGSDPNLGGVAFRSPNQAQAGDLRAGLRVRIFGEFDAPFQFGIGGYVWFPTAPASDFVGDGKVRGMPQLLFGGIANRFVWSLAAGPQFRTTQTFGGVTGGTQLNVGAGVGYLIGERRRLMLGVESYGAFTMVNEDASVNDTFRRAANVEVLGDVRYRIANDWEIGAGAGPGIAEGIGTPDFRGVMMLAYSPETKRPPPDRDSDGIIDEQDACPDVKGVANVDPQKNGCPPDRDDDGIIDEQDTCPDVKGVANADPKKNGCPPDRDDDGIIDEQDACPDEKGEPDPDPKKNGCPVVHVTEQEIVILEQVQFDFDRAVIKKVSDPLLDKVAAVFKQYPEIKNVEVQGHTDNVGKPVHNRRLSQKRAEAVVDALVSRGVPTSKLTSKGYGPDAPIDDNATPEGRQNNRRVQFKILEREPKAQP